MNENAYTCPCCLFKLMRVRLDKKGRPFFQCGSCGSILFARLGDVGIFTVANVLRMLDANPEVIAHARAEALRAAATPGAALALVAPVTTVNGAPVAGASGAASNGKVAA